MRPCLNAIFVLVFAGFAQAQAITVDQSRAALALAQAKRVREVKKTEPTKCFDNLDDALAFSKKNEKPLVMWVGMKCEDVPEVRGHLSEAVHCHLSKVAEDPTPRIMFTSPDGGVYKIDKDSVNSSTGPVIRKVIGLDEPKKK